MKNKNIPPILTPKSVKAFIKNFFNTKKKIKLQPNYWFFTKSEYDDFINKLDKKNEKH